MNIATERDGGCQWIATYGKPLKIPPPCSVFSISSHPVRVKFFTVNFLVFLLLSEDEYGGGGVIMPEYL